MLLQTIQKTQGFTARPIQTGLGERIQRPTVSTSGLVVISVLMLLQLIGLAYLAWYIYQVPTWTAMLDSLAVARISSSLDKRDIPSVGSMSENDLTRLSDKSGLIGVIHTEDGLDESAGKNEVELGLGAPGLFHRRLAKFSVQRSVEMSTLDCQCEGCQKRRVVAEDDSTISSGRC